MKKIRERQQELNLQKARAAKEAQQKKKLDEMRQKRIAHPLEMKRGGQRLGHGTTTTSNTITDTH
jgi:hypothetical protein